MEKGELNGYEKRMAVLRSEEEIKEYVEQYCKNTEKQPHEIINEKMTTSDLKMSEIIRASGINVNYGYNILNGIRKRPSRDRLIALCIGSQMDFEETQQTLDSAGTARLYYKSERDVRIAAAINNGVCDVFAVNMDLSEHGLEPLEV